MRPPFGLIFISFLCSFSENWLKYQNRDQSFCVGTPLGDPGSYTGATQKLLKSGSKGLGV